jgi:hypothetical protein
LPTASRPKAAKPAQRAARSGGVRGRLARAIGRPPITTAGTQAEPREICGIAWRPNGGQLGVLYSDGSAATLIMRPHESSPASGDAALVPCRLSALEPQEMIVSGAPLLLQLLERACNAQ